MRLYKTQYSFRISGNRGYDSNRVRLIKTSLRFLYIAFQFMFILSNENVLCGLFVV